MRAPFYAKHGVPMLTFPTQNTLNAANKITGKRGDIALPVDFVGLHNIAKHCIYMKEAFDAALLTVEDLISQHKQHFLDPPLSHASAQANLPDSTAQENLPDTIAKRQALATQNMLKLKHSFFQSTKLRVASLETRIGNIIALVSYAVTTEDSVRRCRSKVVVVKHQCQDFTNSQTASCSAEARAGGPRNSGNTFERHFRMTRFKNKRLTMPFSR
jgi:hypothetical protein